MTDPADQVDGLRADVVRGGSLATQRPDDADAAPSLILLFLFEGEVRYWAAGRAVDVPKRRLVAFWGGLAHRQVGASADAELVRLHVPLTTVLRFGLGRDFRRRLMAGLWVVARDEFDGEAAMVRQWISDLAGDAYARQTVELEVEARLLRIDEPSSKERAAPPLGARAGQVDAMTAYLAKHFHEEIDSGDVADAAGLGAGDASALFRRCYGLTVAQYLQRLRLAHAQLMLLTTPKTVLDVAFDSGFGSLPSFYAAFRAHFGQSPGAYRRCNRSFPSMGAAPGAWAAAHAVAAPGVLRDA